MTPDRLLEEPDVRRHLGGIGHTKYYELLGSGELRSVKLGRRRLVPESEVVRFIEARKAEAA